MQHYLDHAEHYRAIGQTDFYLTENFPWNRTDSVQTGGFYNHLGATDFKFVARIDGMTFSWSLPVTDLSQPIIDQLPVLARELLAHVIADEVLPLRIKYYQDEVARLSAQAVAIANLQGWRTLLRGS